LPAGRPRTATITITNTGTTPAAYFVDARRDGLAEVALRSINPPTYRTPGGPLDSYPRFLVPSRTRRLTVTATAAIPLELDIQPYAAGGFYSGDPDVPGTGGPVAVATVAGRELAPTTWLCDANPRGPFLDAGGAAEVTCSATATLQPFDRTVTSSTGNLWLSATDAAPLPYRPLVLAPGRTGTILVTLVPDGAPGTRVSGELGIATFDQVTGFGAEVAAIEYGYTVAP
jgi:hypothetical protein